MVYLFSLIPTPEVVVTESNRILCKFLWKGTDKVTRLSTINDYEKGGIKNDRSLMHDQILKASMVYKENF